VCEKNIEDYVTAGEKAILKGDADRCPKCGMLHDLYVAETDKYLSSDSLSCPIKDVELIPCERCGQYHAGNCA